MVNTTPARSRQRPRAIRTRLMLIVVTLVIPAWIAVVIAIVNIYRHDRENASQSTIAIARALAAAVDRELAGATATAQVLAASPHLASDDLAAFQREGTAELMSLGFGNNFILSDIGGQQLVNALIPFGQPLSMRADLTTHRKAIETRKPMVSDVFTGNVVARPLIGIVVPVIRHDEVKYTLGLGLFTEYFSELLVHQQLRPGWHAAIFDSSGATVATHKNRSLVGHRGSPVLLTAMAQAAAGTIETTLDGVPVLLAFSRSEISNWAVAIWIPVAELSGDFYVHLLASVSGALILLGVGLGLAGFQSTQIARAMHDLIPPALALGQGEVPAIPRLPVHEADNVAQALDRAAELLRNRTVERDRAEREKRIAESVARMKDEFIANVSHELRTPLTSIVGSLGLLNSGSGVQLPAGVVRLISIAHTNAQRLGRLVNDILDIEKMESGKITMNLSPIDLGTAVERAIEANIGFAEKYGVGLRLDPDTQSCVVRADLDRLIQVVTNLLSNAIKFSPRGQKVVVSIKPQGEVARVTVRDHGPGIPLEFKPRLFEKFAQADTADARQNSGSGLGLSIVKEIVTRHGGTVGFEEAPDGGSIFHFEIPLWHGANAAPCDENTDGARAVNWAQGAA
ncbi:MAG TPA: sensor histidine kinase [Xanthobacteraceae bacterium]|nr:sensor histidine kinase [Xanthobacteraceae bacterium]